MRTKKRKKKINWVDKSSKKDDWYTPDYVLSAARRYFGGVIPLDPATSADNPTAARVFYTAKNDGLVRDWSAYGGTFVNPPYGKAHGFHAWIRKIYEEAEKGVPIWALLPCGARFSTKYFQNEVLTPFLRASCFIDHRVPFRRTSAPDARRSRNPHDSAYYGFNVDPERFASCAWQLGAVFRMDRL